MQHGITLRHGLERLIMHELVLKHLLVDLLVPKHLQPELLVPKHLLLELLVLKHLLVDLFLLKHLLLTPTIKISSDKTIFAQKTLLDAGNKTTDQNHESKK